MSDHYQHGYDDGYGRQTDGNEEYPQTDGDKYSYQQGLEHGQRHRKVADELDREYNHLGY